MSSAYIETYGCSANKSQSETMAGLLNKYAYNIVDDPEKADVIIINSCAVKAVTEQKILYRIKEFSDNGRKLVITGCLVDAAYNRIRFVAPDASFVSSRGMSEIVKVVDKVMSGGQVTLLDIEEKPLFNLPKVRINPVVNIVPIATGCTGHCTYCATKLVKGDVKSYPKILILQDIERSIKEGCKEVWLTGQDTGTYGLDKQKTSQLPELISDIAKIPGDFKIRVGMMNIDNIKDILPELLDAFNSKKVYKFFHLPVQSGDNDILKQMGRKHSVEDYIETVDEIRSAFKINLWTDVIVGFPGETDGQFRNTMELMKRVDPDLVNISRYAMRPGTPAELLRQLPTEVVKERTRMLTNQMENIAFVKNKEQIGWKGDILISERGKRDGQWIGRNYAYKSVVINKSGNLLGRYVRVKIIDAVPDALIGWPITEQEDSL